MVILRKHKDHPVHSFWVKFTINSCSNHIWLFRLPTVLLHLPALHFSCFDVTKLISVPMAACLLISVFIFSPCYRMCLTTWAGGGWELRIPSLAGELMHLAFASCLMSVASEIKKEDMMIAGLPGKMNFSLSAFIWNVRHEGCPSVLGLLVIPGLRGNYFPGGFLCPIFKVQKSPWRGSAKPIL